jgi:hypothetical protein
VARFERIYEVGTQYGAGEWNLYLQWGTYHYDDGDCETGYRFIWRRPEGYLQPARGQARIPSAAVMFELIERAMAAGWFIRCEGQSDPLESPEPET